MRRFGRPVGNTDSLSFLYWNDARRRRDDNPTVEITNGNAYSEPPLEVEDLELYATENAVNQKTHKYELVQDHKDPVLRRGFSFYMAIKCKKRPVDFSRDVVKVIFEFGKYPSVPKDTKVVLPLTSSKARLNPVPTKWDVMVHRQAGNNLIIHVQIGCAVPVGVWKCKVVTSQIRNPKGTPHQFEYQGPIYILFNPYCPNDTVYMPNEGNLNEYIQNDVGKVYKGSYKQPVGRHWIFGQFEDTVLPACIFILDQTMLKPTERGNPIKVSRAISAMVNSVDDNGVIKGRWRTPYDDGTAPWDWSGSAKILEEYMEGHGKPVKYGQCWVYSAVTVTICRALGLPCRSVTNYVSAHDTNQSLTIDKFFDEEGDELTSKDNPEYGFDSIWNFHVWNDVWMARPDLPPGAGGWQAIDATPQEASDNTYQCGPAPLEAIRKGDIGLGYDVPFIFAEVNADVCHFVKDSTSDWGFTKSKTNHYHVGRMILTKALGYTDDDGGNTDAEDITAQYKNEEGTHEERLAVYNAVRGVDRAMKFYDYPSKEKEDVFMDLVALDKAIFGGTYKARVILENRSGQNRTLKALISSSSIYYTGITASLLKKAQGEFVMRPGQQDTLALTLYPSDYVGKLVDYCMVKIYALIRIKETNQTWSEEDDFVLEKPKLKVEVVGRLQAGRLCQIKLSFVNPLDTTLTKCRVTLEGAGTVRGIKERVPREVPPLKDFSHTVLVTPRKSGSSTLVGTFSSDEIIDVHGSLKVDIV